MIDTYQLLILSMVQGITEFLPISSSAHLIIIPEILSWQLQPMYFDVFMHFGSLLAILVYIFFNKEIKKIESFEINNFENIKKIIVAVIPVLLIGYSFHEIIESYLRNLNVIIASTIIIAVLIIVYDIKSKKKHLTSDLTYKDAVIIGLFQILALIPGASRSGVVILGALILGYKKQSSLYISYLLSVPVIIAATSYESFMIINDKVIQPTLYFDLIVVTIGSFLSSYFTIVLLMKFIQKISFLPFMIYRIVLGIFLLVFFV
ncbi:MAG: undecaprenyl-diphosphate phosphatase [Pseudomonadota bacterium]|nr:undecaprenyl-diphosphate phosphatase [Pseudomonadota bacterium]